MRLRLLLLSAIVLLVPKVAWAACDGPGPPFRTGAPSANTVVVGTVVDAREPLADGPFAGYSSSFTLRVDHLLRGKAGRSIEIEDVQIHCAGPILARRGNVIAIAFGAKMFGTSVNAVGFIEGAPHRSDIDRVSLAEAYDLVGVPMPSASEASTPFPWLPALAALAIGTLAVAAVVAFSWPGNVRFPARRRP